MNMINDFQDPSSGRENGGHRSRKNKRPFRILWILLITCVMAGLITGGIVLLFRKDGKTNMSAVAESAKAEVVTEEETETVPETTKAAKHSSVLQTVEKAPTTETTTAPDPEAVAKKEAEKLLSSMSTEEKVAQLFFVTPEALTGTSRVTAAGDATKQALKDCPVGGIIYFPENIVSPEQLSGMLQKTYAYSKEVEKLPVLLGTDEEGGEVARIADNSSFSVTKFPDMKEIGAGKDPAKAYEVGDTIGKYLLQYGFNLDFAPDADVLTNPDNKVIGVRSFGSDPAVVTEMSAQVAKGLKDNGIIPVYKHFPDHGATEGDTHKGFASVNKTLDELMQAELVPFQKAVDGKEPCIMVSHISLPAIAEDSTPASISPKIVNDILRKKMGYDGMVITDAMNMGAISENYSAGNAAVKAVQAGVDMVLMPSDFKSAYAGVLDAVKSGTITEERLNESVLRIILMKEKYLK